MKILLTVMRVVVALCCLAAPAGAQSAQLNQPVTLNITLPQIRADHAEAALNLGKQKGDKNLVLLFLSEQCGVTYFYKARLQKLVRDFEDRGFAFVGVRSGKKLHPEAPVVLPETGYLKMPFADDVRGELAARFGIRQSLMFAVVDRAGRLRYLGGLDDSVDEAGVRKTPLRDALRQLAAGKPVAVQSGKSFGCALVPVTSTTAP